MLKHLILICFLFFLTRGVVWAQDNKDEFFLSGKVIGRDTGLIVLGYISRDNVAVMDTTYLKDGSFGFKGVINEPTVASLLGETTTQRVEDPDYTRIFLEPKKMTAILTEGKYKDVRITGSYSQKQLDTLNMHLQPVFNELKPLDVEYTRLKKEHAQGDTSKILKEHLREQRLKVSPYLRRINQVLYAFVRSHPDSYVSAWILSDFVNIDQLPPDSAKGYYYGLNPKIRNSRYGREVFNDLIAQGIFNKALAAIGNRAPLFELRDIHNKIIKLSSFRGKDYVLLDFWASWCQPCLDAIPYLQRTYKKYHDKGLAIISMSWDFSKNSWLKAVLKHKMAKWYNIYLDINQRHDFLSEKYGIDFIPQFILIDKTGIIIGRYNWDQDAVDLDKKLQEVFN